MRASVKHKALPAVTGTSGTVSIHEADQCPTNQLQEGIMTFNVFKQKNSIINSHGSQTAQGSLWSPVKT